LVTCLILAGAVACACSDPVGPGGLVATLLVRPDTVAAGDTFHVAVTIENPTAHLVTLYSGSSCVVLPNVLRGGQGQRFAGTGLGCLAVTSSFPLAAGDSLRRDFALVAMMEDTLAPPYGYTVTPPVGSYVVRAEMQVALPNLEAPLVVARHASQMRAR
jgi:hypothetical protein